MFTETLVLCCVFLKSVNATNFDDALIYCCLIFITGKTTTRSLRSHSGLFFLVKLSTAFIYLSALALLSSRAEIALETRLITSR